MTPSFPCIKLYIPEMCCGAETALIEKAMLITVVDSVGMQASEIRETILSEMSIRISAMQTEADIKQILDLIGLDCAVDKINRIVKFHSDAEHCFAILEKLQQAGYDAVVVASNKTSSRQNVTESLPWTRLGIAFVFAAAAEAIELTHALPEWAIMACAAIAILLAGFQTIFKGLGFLFRLIFNMDTLMSVAVIGAVCLGAWPEAAMVMVLYEIGEAIEDMSMTRARNAIRKLMDVAPTEVTVKVGESWKRMKAEAVPAGSLYRIEPGERETPMPSECRIPSSLVATLRKAMAHSSHRNRLPDTASLPCASTAAVASSSVKAKAIGQYRRARLRAVNKEKRVFFT